MASLLFLILLPALPLFSPVAADLATDRTALLAFQSAVGLAVLPWNSSFSACQWKGVICSGKRVTALRLPAIGLAGRIPTRTLGKLSELSFLSLRNNALSGPLPADLDGCTKLRFMYLNRNRFSGEIPPFLNSLAGLIRLNLAENNLSGKISSSLNNLTHLTALHLEKNNLSGEMPDLDLPKLAQFNISFNRLKGRVPVKLRSMPFNSFLGMAMCGGPLVSCPGESSQAHRGSKKLSAVAKAGLVYVCIVILYFLAKSEDGWCEPCNEKAPAMKAEPVIAGNDEAAAVVLSPEIVKKELVFLADAPMIFELEDLLTASAEVLGKGTCGVSYKAAMETDVAVKRLRDVKLPEREFVKKVEDIGATNHPNILPLRAYYYSREEKLLIYDYMLTGNLYSLLHDPDHFVINWNDRIKIAQDAAHGIRSIHSRSPTACHGNIKSSNILITSDFRALVSDHGIADLVSASATSIPNRGYAAPEVIDDRSLTQKADVFSFGVLLLELLTRKSPTLEEFNEGGASLLQWVESNRWTGMVFDSGLVNLQSPMEDMLVLLHAGIACCSETPEDRPDMTAVVAMITPICTERPVG